VAAAVAVPAGLAAPDEIRPRNSDCGTIPKPNRAEKEHH
jgi:hypothetical protein